MKRPPACFLLKQAGETTNVKKKVFEKMKKKKPPRNCMHLSRTIITSDRQKRKKVISKKLT